ncbi:quaternary amine ABC transporter ATP-binding protein [Sporosarcina ureilytica]|uniref:Quaternary amine transport ATP-binding protein n=1 Tax=Sporosarcina ureilytica TaxID=298596 RepID=A0A1D8JG28_9BACL|nr:glycine betaine/L-proline ABC transporter ATP-binding protein [Sporosarcina ureilytica]AOV07664.1 ABC transporter ATP-binding protein [Sporosarcina ureilytica]
MEKIEIKNLTKIFGAQPKQALTLLNNGDSKDEILEKTGMTVGVNKASFTVKSGEVFVIMGLSGSGKSTLIRLVNRLIEPTSGEVIIDGENLTSMDEKSLIETRRKKLGMVFQNFGLLPHRSVLSNVAYGLEIQNVDKSDREARALKIIEDVGLKGYENSYPSELSGGMQQRVGIARALTNDPDILLMDEAFSALDPIIRKEMQDELMHLQSKLGKTILFITHDLDEALKLGDRIAIMKEGEIVQIGTSEEILENPADEYVSKFVQDVDRSKVLKASHIMESPQKVANPNDSLQTVVRKMKELGRSSIFVMDDEQNYKGLVTIDDAVKASQEDLSLKNVIIEDSVRKVPLNTALSELIDVAVETKYPIAVVEDGKLLGTISRTAILSGLVLGKEKNKDEVIVT